MIPMDKAKFEIHIILNIAKQHFYLLKIIKSINRGN